MLTAAVDGRIDQLFVPAVAPLLPAVDEGPPCQQPPVEFAADPEDTAEAVFELAHCSVMVVSAPLELAKMRLDSVAR